MKNKIINTFASIGVITVIAIACSSALSEDNDVIIPNNNNNSVVVDTNTNTNTNTSVQGNEVGRYQLSATPNTIYIIDTKTGSYTRVNATAVGDWRTLPAQ